MVNQKNMRRINIGLLVILVSVAIYLSFPVAVRAQSETAYDLINTVNALRAAHGLAAYQIDPWLMSFAQEHSDYQASTHTSTHVHSDGTHSWDIGIQENVAAGDAGYVTVSVAVYEIWVDWGHLHPMIGYLTGEVGAGVALADDGQIYYTLNIRPGAEAPDDSAQPAAVTAQPSATAPFVPLLTSTPDETGAIIHVVGVGEALWSIAISYGVTANDIRQLNGMAPDNTFIYVGQRLIIRPGGTVTPVSTSESTATSTRRPSATAIPVTETRAPTKTATPALTIPVSTTDTPKEPVLTNQTIGTIFLVVGILGMVIVLIFGFKKSPKDKSKDDSTQ